MAGRTRVQLIERSTDIESADGVVLIMEWSTSWITTTRRCGNC